MTNLPLVAGEKTRESSFAFGNRGSQREDRVGVESPVPEVEKRRGRVRVYQQPRYVSHLSLVPLSHLNAFLTFRQFCSLSSGIC